MPAHPTAPRDQASGLRDMLSNRPTQVIAFVAGGRGSGRTTLAVETARSLARMGHRVILVDENESASNALAAVACTPGGDLLDALVVGTPMIELVTQIEADFWVACGAKAAALLRSDSPKGNEIAARLMTPMETAANFVLIDSLVLQGGHLSLLSAQAHHMIAVVAADASAITLAYTVIKRLAKERGRDGFHLAITHARTETEAATIYDNLKRTALQHLGVRVEYFGNLPFPLPHNLGYTLLGKLPISNRSTAERFGQKSSE